MRAAGRFVGRTTIRKIAYAMMNPNDDCGERRFAIAHVCFGIEDALAYPAGTIKGDSARSFIRSPRKGGLEYWVDLCGADGEVAREDVMRLMGDSF